uniref:Zinc metalloproteinase n=1 Tax=Acrobeloides nanus TaxID=290746 RepID=A0A914CKK6_9BILA
MFRIILLSSLFALSLAALLNGALPDINGLPDFSDITDNVTDAVKSRMSDLASKGIGRHVEELIGIQKKLKIINKIAGEQVKHVKHGNTNTPAATDGDRLGKKNKDEVLDSLLFQGDMFLTEVQLDRIIENTAQELGWSKEVLTKLGVNSKKSLNPTRGKRQAIQHPPNDFHWALPISYYYDDNIPDVTRQVIRDTFAFYANHTCLTFQESATAVPRIHFRNATSGCFTYVGFLGNDWYGAPSSQTTCTICQGAGLHPVNLGEWFCNNQFGSISHEIFHAFGVFHHHSRSDRDDYLSLSAANLADKQFTRLTTSDSYNYGTMYDYGSVMHYGIDGMTAKESLYQSTMGAGLGPQFGDIVLINNQYQCFCQSATVTCVNGGYPNPNGCNTCLCPGGYGGTTCSDRDPGTENGGDTLQATTSDSCLTLKTSIGNDDDISNLYYQKSWFHIQAPAGKQVQLIFNKAGASPNKTNHRGGGCNYRGVEVKLISGQLNRTGTLFCGDDPALVSTSSNFIPFTSDSNLAILQIYTQLNKFNLEVKYRYVDSTTSPTLPGSCQPCQDKASNCNDMAQYCTDPNNPQIAASCPVTCGTCPT